MIAFALIIVGISISGHIVGQNAYDFNWWIALLIYAIPAFFLSALNGILLLGAQKLVKHNYFRICIGLIPSIVLLGFLFTLNGSLEDIDGPMEFIAISSIIPIFITYLIWIRKFLKSDESASV
ncbi:MAG: hypothetical protein CL605_03120 [Altibacter sp.]|nr:hypothetical protein [Altibacter sp.]